MAWNAPATPVAGTIITVAFWNTNGRDNLNWLRALTGNADPPGSDYVIVSDSTTGTSWQRVPTDAIAEGAVTNSKLADAAVSSGKIAGGNILSSHLASLSVIAGKIAAGAVGATELADGAVTSSKIAGGNVLAAAIASGAVVAGKIGANAVTGTEIAAGAITYPKVSTSNTPSDGQALIWDNANSTLKWASVGSGGTVPSGAVVWFETLAALTAAGSGWSHYTAGDGRLLIAAGTSGAQTFIEATNYGSSWSHGHPIANHAHGASALGVSGSTGSVQAGRTPNKNVTAGAGSEDYISDHTHNEGSLDVTGTTDAGGTANTDSVTWLPFMRAGVYGIKS